MDWNLVITILGSFIGLLGAIYQLRQFTPRKRSRLKLDLEILNSLEKNSESYKTLSKHIDKTINSIYGSTSSKFKIYNVGDFIFGLIFIVGFTILSVYIYQQKGGFSWWLILTVNFAFAGFGGILNGIDKKQKKDKGETKHRR